MEGPSNLSRSIQCVRNSPNGSDIRLSPDQNGVAGGRRGLEHMPCISACVQLANFSTKLWKVEPGRCAGNRMRLVPVAASIHSHSTYQG